MVKTYPFSEILGWSASRYDVFSYCKRKYYYSYYAKFDPEFERSRIDRLKKLTTIPLETGSLTHDIIAAILQRIQKSSEPLNHEKLFNVIRSNTEKACKEKTFFETYYHVMDSIPIEPLAARVQEFVFHFLDSERFGWIRTRSNAHKGQWIIEPEGYGETRIAGLKAYCKVDFLLPDGDEIHILDWKTGKKDPEKHRKQLLGYSLYARDQFNCQQERIKPLVAYLKDGYEEESLILQPGEVAEFETIVKNETEAMYEFNSNTRTNRPKEKEVFTKTTNVAFCNSCEFKELCF